MQHNFIFYTLIYKFFIFNENAYSIYHKQNNAKKNSVKLRKWYTYLILILDLFEWLK